MDFTDNSGSGSSSTMKKFKSIVANISTACRKCVDICSVEKSAALAPGACCYAIQYKCIISNIHNQLITTIIT